MFLPERSYSKITVYTQSITNAGMDTRTVLCVHEEAKHVHLGGCLSGACDRDGQLVRFDQLTEQNNRLKETSC